MNSQTNDVEVGPGSDLLVIVSGIFVLSLIAAVVTIYAVPKTQENQTAAQAVKANMPPIPPRNTMTKILDRTSTLPANLYAGLNYGAGNLQRIPASRALVDLFAPYHVSTKQMATVGEDLIFYLRQMPDGKVLDQMNRIVERTPGVVMVLQQVPGDDGRSQWTLFGFIDEGVNWKSEDQVYYDGIFFTVWKKI